MVPICSMRVSPNQSTGSGLIRLTSKELIRDIALNPGGVIEQACRVGYVVGGPAKSRSPSGARKGRLLGFGIGAIGHIIAIYILGDGHDAPLSSIGEIFHLTGAIVDIGDDGRSL